MMSKPLPDSLNSDPEHRIFFDPPEIIQRAFGGRPWFFETGCVGVHRVGVFRGLGWQVSPLVVRANELADGPGGPNGVRITIMQKRGDLPRHDLRFIIEFLHRRLDPDDMSAKLEERVTSHFVGLRLDELKDKYGEVFGEHAL